MVVGVWQGIVLVFVGMKKATFFGSSLVGFG